MVDAAACDFPTLLRRAGDGDRDALGELWRRYQPLLLRYLRGRASSAADDVASQVWIDAARGLAGFEGGEVDFRRWLLTIARRRAIDESRRTERRTRAEQGAGSHMVPDRGSRSGADPADEAMARHDLDEALALIRRLPVDMADAVLLRVVADLSVSDIASIMGRREGNVRVLVHRGLQRLAGLLPPRASDSEIPVTPGHRRAI